MLFSELNKINLNVLIQDSPYESVPDISACYVHNADNWTIFCNELYEDPTEANPTSEPTPIVPGWNVTELSCTKEDAEPTYLYRALTDISNSLLVATDISSDLVKVYSGEFAPDGTVDYDAIINCEGLFENVEKFKPRCNQSFVPHNRPWWTFNNGAFQWIGGWPKSIFECRFSYGPFYCGPREPFYHTFPPHDPHHEDSNHKMFDHVSELSFLPNLIFIFNEWHTLKGIVSLPCANKEMVEITKNWLRMFLEYAKTHFSELTFKNIDDVIRKFGYEYYTIPLIRVSRNHINDKLEPPIEAVLSFTNTNKIIVKDEFKYIFSNVNDFPTFFEKSCWKNYYILDSMHIEKTILPAVGELTYKDTNKKIIDTVNELTKATKMVFYSLVENNRYTLLSTSYLAKPRKKIATTALMTIGDLFKHAKEINNLNFEETNACIIVLPKGFCTTDAFKFIANVKYL